MTFKSNKNYEDNSSVDKIIKKSELKSFIMDLIEYMEDPENIWYLKCATSWGISKEKLEKMCAEFPELQEAIELISTVQETRLTEFAAAGKIDRTVALRALEQYANWNEDALGKVNDFSKMMQDVTARAGLIAREKLPENGKKKSV